MFFSNIKQAMWILHSLHSLWLEKTATILPHKNKSEKWLQKFKTDDVSLLRSGSASDWLIHSSDVISRENQTWGENQIKAYPASMHIVQLSICIQHKGTITWHWETILFAVQ